MSIDVYLDIEQSRAIAYKLLSTCYYLPEQKTIEQLDELIFALQRICPQALDSVHSMQQEVDLEQLTIDFSQLFVGPFKLIAAPYGSVYLEGKREVMGASTIDVERRYLEAGLDIAGTLKEAPDHVAVELEFVYYLVYKEIEAIEIGSVEDANEWRHRQKTFLSRHLGAWIGDLADAMEEGATTEFYRNLARATRIFVADDIKTLSEVGKVRLESTDVA